MSRWIVFAAMMALTACAAQKPAGPVADPFEPMNRKVHAFNKGFDRHVVKPVSGGGGGGRLGQAVGNAGANLALPGKAVNHLLQGHPAPAIRMTFRFFVNTTLGFAGLADPATKDFALPEEDTDFGQTLAVWGVAEGPYLELPLMGPTTLRDGAGKLVDIAIDPMRGVLNHDQYLAGLGARAVGKAAKRARFGKTVDSVLYNSADSYSQTRLIWSEHRRHELGQQGDDIDPYAE